MENDMVLDETMNEPNTEFGKITLAQAAMEPRLALMPHGNDYSQEYGRQHEDLPSSTLPVFLFDDEDGEDEDMDEDESFDDMDDDFDDDFDDDEDDDFDEEDDYEEEDDDYDYEEDVDYDDFDE